MQNKVTLLRDREADWSFNERIGTSTLTRSLPFYQGGTGGYVHRVRAGQFHYWDGRLTHVSISLWCGQVGFIYGQRPRRKRGKLMADVPAGEQLCATCAGRFQGSGLGESIMIGSHPVIFQPKFM